MKIKIKKPAGSEYRQCVIHVTHRARSAHIDRACSVLGEANMHSHTIRVNVDNTTTNTFYSFIICWWIYSNFNLQDLDILQT